VPIPSTPTFPVQYGKYELLERIGEGGMAEVFRARLPGAAGFEKIVVVKRILPHLAKKPDFVKMFVDEAKLAAKVQHQNVVQVFELGEADDGELYMAMEYINGVDLRRLLVNARERKLRIPVWFVLHAVSEILNGLMYAHELVDHDGRPLHVVHRDVTPGNVFISYQGEVKLADFGIAKAVGRVSETEAGQVKGNAPFMAPEAIWGRVLDARADVFSVGVVLWACLALRLPFEGNSNYETAKLVCEAKREPPSKYNPLVTAELDSVSLQALEIERARRIPSAREFQARLLEILAKLRPKLLPSDVRHVVDVLSGRKAPDAQFADKPPPMLTLGSDGHAKLDADVRIDSAVWSPGQPKTPDGNALVDDLGLEDPSRVRASSPPPSPSLSAPTIAGSPVYAPQPSASQPRAPQAANLGGTVLNAPTPMLNVHAPPLPGAPVLGVPAQSPPLVLGSAAAPPAVRSAPAEYAPAAGEPSQSADMNVFDLPDEPLDLPSHHAAHATHVAHAAHAPAPPAAPPVYAAPPTSYQYRMPQQPQFYPPLPSAHDQLPPAAPPPSASGLVRGDMPITSSLVEFMEEAGTGPIVELQRDVEKFYNDANKFIVRYQDGSTMTATGLDECLSLLDPWGRKAAAVSIDGIAWVDIQTFARLCGLDYLAPDSTPLRSVKLVGNLEDRTLSSVLIQIARNKWTGKLVIMDKGVHRVARREIDVMGGAPVHVFADHPSLQFPHLYVQHKLLKKEMIPELVVQVLRTRQPIEEVARRSAFTDLNPYRPVLLRDRLAEIFGWRFGRFAFDTGRDIKGAPFAPSLLRILPDAIQRGYSVEELRRVLEPQMNVKLRKTDAFDAVINSLGLKDKHMNAARKLASKTALSQLLKKNAAETHILLSMAMMLTELEVLVPS
jgi:serine/threonine protein kinase